MSRKSDLGRARRRAATTPTTPKLPRALFRRGFDDIATHWSKKPSADPALLPLVKRALALEGIAVSEALLLAPKVSFRVYGENVVLVRLIEQYGVKRVEQLLEEGAVEFVLWRGDVLKFVKSLPGVHPLVPMTLSTPAHCEPQVSVEMGLKGGWLNKPWPEVKRLAALATERTILPAQDLPQRAITAVCAAHASGGLVADGFDPATPMAAMTPEQIDALARLGGHVHEGMLMLENDYAIHQAEESWEALIKVCARFTVDHRVYTTAEHVLRLQGVPDFLELFRVGAIGFADIVRTRNHRATAEFRRWLWSQPDPRETQEVAKAYVDAITKKKAIDSTWFKAARIAGVGVVGGVAGALVDPLIGGIAGTIAGVGAGVLTSEVDGFGLEKLLSGANPRRFADEVLRPSYIDAIVKSGGASNPKRGGGKP